MIVGQSKSSSMHWHVVIDDRLMCRPELSAKPKSIRDWEQDLTMCQYCAAKLDRMDLDWRRIVAPDVSRYTPKKVRDMLTQKITKS